MAAFYRKPITKDMVSRLREKFSYNPEDGVITRREKSGRFVAGSDACQFLKQSGYFAIYFEGQRYQAHRIAWAIYYGAPPPIEIDHKNRIRSDNRIDNLRKATSSTNKANQSIRDCNTSGYRGVNFYKRTGRWRATIGLDRHLHLGYFDSPIDAAIAYDNKMVEIFGEFASLNFPRERP